MTTDVLERAPAKAKPASKPAGFITVEAGPLAKALKQLAALVERKNTLPILSTVLIEANKDGVLLTATDLDIWASDRAPASCHASEIVKFSACVSAKKLFEAVDALPAGANVTLTYDAKAATARLHIDSEAAFGPVHYRLPALPRDDFPALPMFKPSAEFEMSAFVLGAAMDAVRHAISSEETRYYLNGIFWHVKDDALILAATDGHRLARHRCPLPDGAGDMADMIIHTKSIKLLAAVIDQQTGKEADELDVQIAAGAARVGFTVGTCEMTCKLIDGTYPDYSRVIPTGNDKIAVLKPAHLAGAVKQVMLLSSEKTRAVKCAFEAGKLTVSMMSPENGEASAELRCDYGGVANVDDGVALGMTIGFNAKYLLDILDRMGGELCTLSLADPAAPTAFVNFEGASSDYVLMPMRV